MTDASSHSDHSGAAHHMAQDDLLPINEAGEAPMATHVAVNNGDWFNPATWADGEVPGEGAIVHIPAGVTVAYEGASDAGLFIVRVDGALNMYADNGVETKMVVDTMITSMSSTLTIDADDPGAGTIDIVFAEGTPAAHGDHYQDDSSGDGVLGRSSWDPEQLSLGLVASGTVDIKGQPVEAGLELSTGPAAGATELVFDSTDGGTFGWEPGQKVVIGGTKFLGRDDDGVFQTQDEVREITDVRVENGQMIVTLDSPLVHDHTGPTDPTTGEELTGQVGNLTRNVTFSSAAADGNGDGMPDHPLSHGDIAGPGDHYATERGHIMFMHNDDVNMTNSASYGLGRTDKSELIDDFLIDDFQNNRLHEDNGVIGQYDPDVDVEIMTPADEITNQRGRYAIHIHQAGAGGHDDHDDHTDHGVLGPCPDTGGPICQCGDQDGDGIKDCEDEDFVDGAYLEGNVVWGSPGWGIVQHSSAAVLDGNLVFDVNGSGFVAESGDETGRWEDNLAIGTYGDRNRPEFEDSAEFNEDDGFDGFGFYLKARSIDMIDNTAISTARAGFFYHQNGIGLQDTDVDGLGAIGDFAYGLDSVNTEDVPIRLFEGNSVIAAQLGIRIATDPMDSVRKFNDAYSHMKDFVAWEVDEAGVRITYSSKYVFEDFLILGTEDKVTKEAIHENAAFYFGASVADITVVNSHVETFDHAIMNWSMVGHRQEYRRGYWDPKSPSPWHPSERYEGMGNVEGIDNPAYNLWNNNFIGVTYDDIEGMKFRTTLITVETEEGETARLRGSKKFNNVQEKDHIDIELLGDSRDGGLVALWREDIAEHPNQALMLQKHIPLAYQDSEYLSKVYFEDGSRVFRQSYDEYVHGVNDDIWSGTALEFAKEDSIGRHVFLYGDFSPLDPSAIERTMTTNEKILFTKDMIDGVLQKDGYYHVTGGGDVRFVVMKMVFTDRLTGQWETKEFLVALDLAWEVPEGAFDAGFLTVSEDLIVADEYRVFENGVLVEGREPIDLRDLPRTVAEMSDDGGFPPPAPDEPEDTVAEDPEPETEPETEPVAEADPEPAPEPAVEPQPVAEPAPVAAEAEVVDQPVSLTLVGTSGRDVLNGDDGDDVINGGIGYDVISGGDGNDRLNGERGFDTIEGGAGDDSISGEMGKDVLFGGAGQDVIDGGQWHDTIDGGEGNDLLLGGRGKDQIAGGTGNDVLLGGEHEDILDGGAGNDRLAGGTHDDTMTGGEGQDAFLFEENAGTDVITDFEDGVDAIEFMIQGFGPGIQFDDISITRDGADAVLEHAFGTIRLVDFDADDVDAGDFVFAQGG